MSKTVHEVSKSFTIPNLRTSEITRLLLILMETGTICVVLLLINWLVNVAKTFTDILKYYVL